MPPECGPKGSAREAQEGRAATKVGGYVVRGSSVGSVGVEAGAGFVCSGGGVDFSGLLGVVWGCLLCGGGGCRDSGRQEAGGGRYGGEGNVKE